MQRRHSVLGGAVVLAVAAAATGVALSSPASESGAAVAMVAGAAIRGQSARSALYQVSPATLRVVRSWRLTGWRPAWGGWAPVTVGPHGSVWAGYLSQLRRLNPTPVPRSAGPACRPG